MYALIAYASIAVLFSFLCSIAEAVILSVNPSYISVLEKEGNPAGAILRKLKNEIGKTLSAILTLNTIAHTVGAVGAGAQAAVIFGSAYLGLASAVLTLLILIFSEIIPKTLGARHWKKLAPITSYGLRFLVWILYPFVWLSEKLTGGHSEGNTLSGFSRQEFSAMAEISAEEGQLAEHESEILINLMKLRKIQIQHAMTPHTVVFSLPESTLVQEYFDQYKEVKFSRFPIYGQNKDHVSGFVLRSDILLAVAQGETDKPLKDYSRKLPALIETVSLARAFNLVMQEEAHVALVVDEYGDMQGILTLEDFVETLLGIEIVDEGDATTNMQELARHRWKRRLKKKDLSYQSSESVD